MTQVQDVMSRHLVTVPSTATITTAARVMRDADVGDVVVTEQGEIVGIVTDRDIVVRAVTAPGGTDAMIGEIVSPRPAMVKPSDSVERAAELMRRHSIRRLPVVENDMALGIVTLGDLAPVENPGSTLAAISAAEPNQ